MCWRLLHNQYIKTVKEERIGKATQTVAQQNQQVIISGNAELDKGGM